MNYQKKRRRQKGRQKRNCEPKYKIWIDEWYGLHATIDKAIKHGILPAITFDEKPSYIYCSTQVE